MKRRKEANNHMCASCSHHHRSYHNLPIPACLPTLRARTRTHLAYGLPSAWPCLPLFYLAVARTRHICGWQLACCSAFATARPAVVDLYLARPALPFCPGVTLHARLRALTAGGIAFCLPIAPSALWPHARAYARALHSGVRLRAFYSVVFVRQRPWQRDVVHALVLSKWWHQTWLSYGSIWFFAGSSPSSVLAHSSRIFSMSHICGRLLFIVRSLSR